jgi:hypothetical protein
MIKTTYNLIPDELYINYMDNLVNRVFKILPLKDEKSETVDTYITNLLFELTGNQQLILFLHNDSQYEMLLSNLQGLLIDDNNYRSIILNCIPIIKSLKKKYSLGGENIAD